MGYVNIKATYNRVTSNLKLYVAKGGGHPLIGRSWLKKLIVSADNLLCLEVPDSTDEIKQILTKKFPSVFDNGMRKVYKG